VTDVTSAGGGFSTATVSTTGAIGCFTFRTTFFTDARLGSALATVRFAVLATLRALLRLAEFALRSLARICIFDPFLRLAMIDPRVCWSALSSYPQRMANQTTKRCLSNLSNDFSKHERVPCLRCDPRHSAPNTLLLCSHCTVVPGGAHPVTWGR